MLFKQKQIVVVAADETAATGMLNVSLACAKYCVGYVHLLLVAPEHY